MINTVIIVYFWVSFSLLLIRMSSVMDEELT